MLFGHFTQVKFFFPVPIFKTHFTPLYLLALTLSLILSLACILSCYCLGQKPALLSWLEVFCFHSFKHKPPIFSLMNFPNFPPAEQLSYVFFLNELRLQGPRVPSIKHGRTQTWLDTNQIKYSTNKRTKCQIKVGEFSGQDLLRMKALMSSSVVGFKSIITGSQCKHLILN